MRAPAIQRAIDHQIQLARDVFSPIPIALNLAIVGDWKSLLSNSGGTGPDANLGGSDEVLVLLEEG